MKYCQVDLYRTEGKGQYLELEEAIKDDRYRYLLQLMVMAASPIAETFPFSSVAGPCECPPALDKDVSHWHGACFVYPQAPSRNQAMR